MGLSCFWKGKEKGSVEHTERGGVGRGGTGCGQVNAYLEEGDGTRSQAVRKSRAP